MKRNIFKDGLTLVEMLIVISIIAIMASIVLSLASRVDDRAKTQLMRNNFAILNSALRQFKEFGYEYKYSLQGYSSLEFPIDCNGFANDGILGGELERAMGLGTGDVVIVAPGHLDEYSGSEVLYYFLNVVPACRQTLEQVSGLLTITNEDASGTGMTIDVRPGGVPTGAPVRPLFRFVDPWGKSLRYDYYPEYFDLSGYPNSAAFDPDREDFKRGFPLITSAGPDEKFGTSDDITNEE